MRGCGFRLGRLVYRRAANNGRGGWLTLLRTSCLGRSLDLWLRSSLNGSADRIARLQGVLGCVALLRGALSSIDRRYGSCRRVSLHSRGSLRSIWLSLGRHTLPGCLRCGGLHGASDSSVWLRGSCLRGLTLHGYRSLGRVMGRALYFVLRYRRRSSHLPALT